MRGSKLCGSLAILISVLGCRTGASETLDKIGLSGFDVGKLSFDDLVGYW